MPPVLILALGAFASAALVKFMAKESRRVNEELDATRAGTEPEVATKKHPTLRRDPATGEYRPRDQ